jgi:uncharacterized RDD family membrane protein YckC
MVLTLLSSLTVRFTKRKKAIHDILSGTSVISSASSNEPDPVPSRILATFNRRLAAYCIDLLMIVPLALFFQTCMDAAGTVLLHDQWTLVFFDTHNSAFLSGEIVHAYEVYNAYGVVILSFCPFLFVSVVYFTVMERTRWKGSFGKFLMKLMVLDSHHKQLSWKTSFTRALLKITPLLLLAFSILSSDKSQAIHDRMCGTVVINRKI